MKGVRCCQLPNNLAYFVLEARLFNRLVPINLFSDSQLLDQLTITAQVMLL